ncbi:MAG: hypothetical protein DRH26_01415 [Deltaproteobacteria bacterium]|nr:MAG: hypothetical protein DRH26_01415 [Deltaproteobacteria bacterium]
MIVNIGKRELEYPDMRLYQEIILLKHWFKGKYVVENVIPYYEPLLRAQEIERHYFWTNFDIPPFLNKREIKIKGSEIPELQKLLGINLDEFKVKNKRQVLRNCVIPELGRHILNSAFRFYEPEAEQLTFFE